MISENVFEYLQSNLSSGTWKPGQRIPSERELCATLGVSRVSVRSAIGKLKGMGLLESRQGGGTFVSPKQMEDEVSVFEFRHILECESAALAAMRATQSQIIRLEEINLCMAEAESNADIAGYDLMFHLTLAQATNNPIIMNVMDTYKDSFFSMFEQNVAVLGKEGVDSHERIIRSIQVRDSEGARQNMREHLQNTEKARHSALIEQQRSMNSEHTGTGRI